MGEVETPLSYQTFVPPYKDSYNLEGFVYTGEGRFRRLSVSLPDSKKAPPTSPRIGGTPPCRLRSPSPSYYSKSFQISKL